MIVSERLYIAVFVLLQAVGALYFGGRLMLSALGVSMRPLPWQLFEALEVAAALGLVAGTVMGLIFLRRSIRQRERMRRVVDQASAAFHENLHARFDGWRLSRAERDVALFAIKGMTTQDIAALRQTTQGTVKAQSAGIYRKAGVNSRAQLASLIVEDFFDDEVRGQKG